MIKKQGLKQNLKQNLKQDFLENVPFAQIFPYEKNYQSHNKNLNHIKNSIKDFGYNKPIVVDENMIILAGHGAFEALKELKYENVPFILKISGLTDKQKRAYRIADNESARATEIIYENLDFELKDLKFDFKDYGLDYQLNYEIKNNEKEITEDSLNLQNKCPKCNYEW